ncbi:hypothetical protein QFC22_000595 [Naganishia vaughanmartiniae]|uniref:Uncharacterized protein n=1 Tax=Naganishia vaughanmartiniae TaxID=1424756 RepID=A0ACC2XNQ9_9TREE|nr:hypothetical protein QFC22_000595 [Naganishia vaughanmartiniae]
MSLHRPLKLAIIGAGPSGFYTASRILSLLPANSEKGANVQVHMYDRLPTPYGLVRYGVAPDHPEVKNCQEKFDGLAADPRFRFFGNVSIGTTTSPTTSTTRAYTYPNAIHVPLSDLVPYYTTVLFTYGSSLSNPLSRTEHSSSSASPLSNVIPALAFVSWYNGHPAYAHLTDQLDLSGINEATVIGHGNVAIDVARMLLKDPETLAQTDMPTPVVDRLRESQIRKVSAVGRRGPAQVSFTTKEFREMVNLPGVAVTPVDPTLMEDAREMVVGDRARKRLMDLMSKAGAKASDEKDRTFELGFLKSPIAFLPSEPGATGNSTSKVSRIKWSLNTLLSPPAAPPIPPHPPAAPATSTDTTPSTTVVARPTGKETTTRSGLVIESVGYRSESLSSPSRAEQSGWALPFDERRGRIMNDGGRVVDESGIMVPGFYTAGWVASGPIGVIASTMQYAFSVASLIINDHFIQPANPASGSTASASSREDTAGFTSPLPTTPERGIPDALVLAGASPCTETSTGAVRSGKQVVEMEDWQMIDRAEVQRAKEAGRNKPREKFLSVREMLQVLP